MSSKTKYRKTSPAGAFYTQKEKEKEEQTEKKVKEEIKRILNQPRYKYSPVRVLKGDGKSRKSTKRKSTKRKSTKRKRRNKSKKINK